MIAKAGSEQNPSFDPAQPHHRNSTIIIRNFNQLTTCLAR